MSWCCGAACGNQRLLHARPGPRGIAARSATMTCMSAPRACPPIKTLSMSCMCVAEACSSSAAASSLHQRLARLRSQQLLAGSLAVPQVLLRFVPEYVRHKHADYWQLSASRCQGAFLVWLLECVCGAMRQAFAAGLSPDCLPISAAKSPQMHARVSGAPVHRAPHVAGGEGGRDALAHGLPVRVGVARSAGWCRPGRGPGTSIGSGTCPGAGCAAPPAPAPGP